MKGKPTHIVSSKTAELHRESMSQKTNIHDDNNDILNNNRKERISKHICPTAKLNPKDINN